MSEQVYRFLECNGRSYCGNNTTKIDQQTVNMGVVVYYGSAMNVVDRHYDYRSKE